jgi:hypothetical protein
MSAAYPAAPFGYPVVRSRTTSGATAETLVLVALVLQVIGAVLLGAGLFFFFAFVASLPMPFFALVTLIPAAVGSVTVLFLFVAYEYSYRRIQAGDYRGAQTPTLVIGILSLFLGVLPGILYLIGYAKLGDAVREQEAPSMGFGPGFTPPATFGPAGVPVACRGCGRVYSEGQYAYCPTCGQRVGT